MFSSTGFAILRLLQNLGSPKISSSSLLELNHLSNEDAEKVWQSIKIELTEFPRMEYFDENDYTHSSSPFIMLSSLEGNSWNKMERNCENVFMFCFNLNPRDFRPYPVQNCLIPTLTLKIDLLLSLESGIRSIYFSNSYYVGKGSFIFELIQTERSKDLKKNLFISFHSIQWMV